MRSLREKIVFQEVPGEIALLFQVTGCSLRCRGCHSSELWNKNNGDILTNQKFESLIIKYKGLITCILFFGGEWSASDLIEKLVLAKKYGLKTCLYTGEEKISEEISTRLDYLKTGPWIEALGGLDSKMTNQKFIDVKSQTILNHWFHKHTHKRNGYFKEESLC